MKISFNDFKPSQVVKFSETEQYPLYDLSVQRSFVLKHDVIPECIPKQIEENTRRIKGRLEVSKEIKEESIAIVGYGPTLKKFGMHIPKHKEILSTSGAHKFLLDRDIIPTYHAEVDFREHKAVHTEESHPDIEYLFCSIVHSKMLDNVEGKRVKLWHIELPNIQYPEGELVLEGYWDIGQEAILIAKALGYRDLHLFGFDYAFEVDGTTHAGFHNGDQGLRVFAKIGDKIYQTSDRFCRGVLAFQKLMSDHPDLKFTLYSDGLLSAYLTYHYGEKGNETKKT